MTLPELAAQRRRFRSARGPARPRPGAADRRGDRAAAGGVGGGRPRGAGLRDRQARALCRRGCPIGPSTVTHALFEANTAGNGEADLTRFVDAVLGGDPARLEGELARLAGEGQEGHPAGPCAAAPAAADGGGAGRAGARRLAQHGRRTPRPCDVGEGSQGRRARCRPLACGADRARDRAAGRARSRTAPHGGRRGRSRRTPSSSRSRARRGGGGKRPSCPAVRTEPETSKVSCCRPLRACVPAFDFAQDERVWECARDAKSSRR